MRLFDNKDYIKQSPRAWLSAITTACNLEKFWLRGRNSLRLEGAQAACKLSTSIQCLLTIICDIIYCIEYSNTWIPSILIVYHIISIYNTFLVI